MANSRSSAPKGHARLPLRAKQLGADGNGASHAAGRLAESCRCTRDFSRGWPGCVNFRGGEGGIEAFQRGTVNRLTRNASPWADARVDSAQPVAPTKRATWEQAEGS